MHPTSSSNLSVVLWLALGLVACGGSEVAVRTPAPVNPAMAEVAYNQICYSLGAKHAQSVKSGRYRPATLNVHNWPASDATIRAGQSLPEAAFTSALADGRLRSALVLGRGGVGKSELARMVEASVCGSLRVVRLSLIWDVVPRAKTAPPAGNVVLLSAAAEMKLAGKDAKAAIDGAMAGRPWLLLLDGLDEVSLGARPRTLRDIQAAVAAMPHMRLVVLSRPPVFRDGYGLTGMQAKVEVPRLPCVEVERVLAGGGPGDDRATALRKFVGLYKLDRKVGAGAACVYPHLSTWRDLAVVRSLSHVHSDAKLAARTGSQLQRNRAGIYRAYLETLLLDDLVRQDIGPVEAMGLVDDMIDAGKIEPDSRAVSLTLKSCLASVGQGDDGVRRWRCKALLQSALFSPMKGKQAWHFANQSIADFFLARRLDRQMAAKGPAGCAAIAVDQSLDECNEIAGFFLGLPRGRQCALDVANHLCERAVPERLTMLLELGLPEGKERAKLLYAARVRAKAAGVKPCARQELERLWLALPKTLRDQAAPNKP